ncbi:MAG: efflux RND transporter periplasmic adaptor subunit [bacterium]|nr:efflux RND transporter periplasmic adaptor subunit [bacterium]
MKKWITISSISVLVLFVLGFIGWRLVAERTEKPPRTVAATRQTVTKDISFTGTVETEQSADISFELSGIIKDLYVSVGDTVTKGQKLALLDPRSVELELAKAHADTVSTSVLDKLSWQKATDAAQNTIAENTKSLEQKRQAVRDAKTALDQSSEIHAKKSQESGDDSSITLSAYATVLTNKAAYNSAKAALETALKSTSSSNIAAKHAADIAYAQLVSTQQAALGDSGLSSLRSLESLARLKASKGIIRAPFDGVITRRSSELGELVTIGQTVLKIETVDRLRFAADVAETDAFALKENMNASITFDALSSNQTINAIVAQIYPTALLLDGVPTFRVLLHTTDTSLPLRGGITANIVVHAEKKDDVIAIPRRAIITKSDKQFVRIQRDDLELQEVEITTGVVGSDGLVEVTSGLSEGDKVVTQ